MATIVRKGDCVYVLTTYFGAPNSGNAWSNSYYGRNYENSKCFGSVENFR